MYSIVLDESTCQKATIIHCDVQFTSMEKINENINSKLL